MNFKENVYLKYIFTGIILIIAYKAIDNVSYFADLFYYFLTVLTPVIIGAGIAFFTYRPSKNLAAKLSLSKIKFIKDKSLSISVLSVYIFIAIIIGVIINFIIPVVLKNVEDLVAHIPQYYGQIKAFIEKNDMLKQLTYDINLYEKLVKYINTDTINSIIDIISKVANSFITFFLSVIFSIYFILYKNRLAEHMSNLKKMIFKNKKEFKIFKYTRKIINLFYSYFTGLALDALLIGTITAIVLSIFKVPYSILLGVIVAFGNMIPFFGSIIAGIIEYVVCAFTFGPVKALWVLVFQLILGQIDGNIIQPKIIGRSVGVSPLTVLLTVVVLGELFGPLGMILGVPVVAALKIVVEDSSN